MDPKLITRNKKTAKNSPAIEVQNSLVHIPLKAVIFQQELREEPLGVMKDLASEGLFYLKKKAAAKQVEQVLTCW